MVEELRIVVGDTVHRGFRHEGAVDGVFFTAEGDNLDEALNVAYFGMKEWAEPGVQDGYRLCRRCFRDLETDAFE